MTKSDSRWQIVCLSPIAWSAAWTSRHGLADAWGRAGHRVLFVDPPQVVGAKPTPRGPESRGVDVVRPPRRLPYGGVKGLPVIGPGVVNVEAARYQRFVRRAVAGWRGEGQRLLLVNSLMPTLGTGIERRLRPEASIYHCADDLRTFAQTRAIDIEREDRVLAEADVVTCVSEAVRGSIAAKRPDAVIVGNAVDADYFASAEPDPRLTALPRPVVGLVGRIDARNDASFLRAAAEAAGTLVIAGPVFDIEIPDGAVQLGWCDREELPGILHALDVGVLCYRRDTPGEALKTFEYLAAGIPVVSSDFAGLGPMRDHVEVVTTPDDFGDALRRALASRSPENDRARQAVAQRNSWTARAEAMLDLVEDALP